MSPDRTFRNLLVTGGAGFIGTNFIRYLFSRPELSGRVINLDKLTYAGNPANLEDIAAGQGDRYRLERVDICDPDAVRAVFERYQVDAVVHFAAESHVDRSILGPREFVNTNVMGTFTLLEAARADWKERQDVLFHHVSTDEVYGSLGAEGLFTETTPYSPRVPIPPPRLPQTTSFAPTTTPTASPSPSPTAQTTTVPISSPRSSSPS